MQGFKHVVAALCLAGAVGAQAAYPEREIRMVVNYGAGGVTDVATRVMVKALEARLGQPVVVENKPGGQATLGPAYVARQPADGYTLGVVTFSAVAITPHMVRTPYTADDFNFIGGFGRFRYGLAVQADSPYRNVQDFLAAARDKPLFFATPGAPNNLAFFDMGTKYGAKFEQVLYKSGTESVSALVGGQVQAVIQTPSEILPQVEGGRLRLLASVSPARWDNLPDMPTMTEQGVDVAIDSWMGIAVPRGTPPAVRARLEAALQAAMQDPALREGLNKMGIDPVWASGQDYDKMLREGYATMRARLERAGAPVLPKP
ncbi:Bug family tripartite tricarboxylate transporter substrate binding protein [Bordetella hinzii]|uniref:Tripartite tricarboxylate transporter family receptor n=1 Tax=Bordetella hinzii OH87 BAL007II TaxID=1331262 RepID=A0ABR4R5H8_9BORD|nr:tripartite tricarboxylate transporter substrate binding protein [Bordetella hinzii]KCB25932.1 tripartite tricarboxylate transporter family receptor [Bordetella hinzii OH87 BAL007II]KCB40767.1 tripartite tricarboxylate transporter family receptor [Bordetella hinzii 5132]QDJ40580.1 tripartite tricarboxylate transporter substrate binding protein [Bordetella hinzii]QDJ45139.1 tripartite tricarboxylate transporter substrate binding protein [Bordetella hinzii]QDJ54051.1 tripartite tricarboxylate 